MHTHIFRNFPANDRSNLIAILQDIQEIYGYLPEQALQDTADYLGMALSGVYGVATFYNQFRLTPLGENVIRVCRGTACHVKESANILRALECELGIKVGETTRDKKFTLESVACIGACSIAPVININNEYFGRLKTKDIPRILNVLRKEKAVKEQENIQSSVST